MPGISRRPSATRTSADKPMRWEPSVRLASWGLLSVRQATTITQFFCGKRASRRCCSCAWSMSMDALWHEGRDRPPRGRRGRRCHDDPSPTSDAARVHGATGSVLTAAMRAPSESIRACAHAAWTPATCAHQRILAGDCRVGDEAGTMQVARELAMRRIAAAPRSSTAPLSSSIKRTSIEKTAMVAATRPSLRRARCVHTRSRRHHRDQRAEPRMPSATSGPTAGRHVAARRRPPATGLMSGQVVTVGRVDRAEDEAQQRRGADLDADAG